MPLKYCRYVIDLPQLEVEFQFGLRPQAICLSAVADRFCLRMLIFYREIWPQRKCKLPMDADMTTADLHVNCGYELNLKRETLKAHSYLAPVSAFAFSEMIEAIVTKHKRRKWVLYPFSASTSASP